MILRIDDFGASSKRWEWHRHKLRPYPEVSAELLDALGRYLSQRGWSATLGITACWVERDSSLVEYPVKFPAQAASVDYWAKRGVFEVACHGLTHCVPGRHVRPWWRLRSNRAWHREYVDAVPIPTQREYLRRAKQILTDRFGPVTTFVPPGNAIGPAMVDYALDELGFRVVTCRPPVGASPRITSDAGGRNLHDRDLWDGGPSVVGEPPAGQAFCTVRSANVTVAPQ